MKKLIITVLAIAAVFFFSSVLYADSEIGVPTLWINGADGGPFANMTFVRLQNSDANKTGRCWSSIFTGWVQMDTTTTTGKQILTTALAAASSDRAITLNYTYDEGTDTCTLAGIIYP